MSQDEPKPEVFQSSDIFLKYHVDSYLTGNRAMYTIKLIQFLKHLQVRQGSFEVYLLGSANTTGSHRMQKIHFEHVRGDCEHISGNKVKSISFILLNNIFHLIVALKK